MSRVIDIIAFQRLYAKILQSPLAQELLIYCCGVAFFGLLIMALRSNNQLPPKSTGCSNLKARIDAAETESAKNCGLSDTLYEKRVQAEYAFILAQASEVNHANTLVELKARGFDPEFTPYQAKEGECDLTGIPEDCCPCGRHP